MKKITITEENFEEVLLKLQKICNKHTMIRFTCYYDDEVKGGKPVNTDYPIIYHYDANKHKDVPEFERKFFNVIKNDFRQAFEIIPESKYFKVSLYKKCNPKPLIDLQFSEGSTILRSGDKVNFYPFGIFSLRQKLTDNKSIIYLYIPSYKQKLTADKRQTILESWDNKDSINLQIKQLSKFYSLQYPLSLPDEMFDNEK